MLSRKFVMLVVVSCVIAFPISYYVMNEWLQSFAYHVTIEIEAFFLTTIALIVIALITVGTQTWRAANSNPAQVIRTE